jgi:hypothetical protein
LVGHDVDVEHEVGGNVTTSRGKLISEDNNGYVIIESVGKSKFIPKDKVYSISDKGFGKNDVPA